MKAIYQKPVTDIILMSTHSNILTGSGGLLGDGETPKDLDLNNAGETTSTSGNLTRRSVWDDEEESEEAGF